jgi:lysophospholipase L1-like esterase
MKQFILSFLLITSGLAQTQLESWLAETPQPPPGANPAAFPTPRLDWFKRVKANNDAAKTMASSIQLVFDGDSITEGWRSGGKEIWEQRYAKINAFNFGISGDRVENVLWRISQGQLEGLNPKLVAIMIGTNNIGGDPEYVAGGIAEIVRAYQKSCPEAVILLQAIFPRRELPTDPARAWIKSVNELIAKLADGQKVIFVDFSDKFLEADGTLSPEVMPDFLHPGTKGYQIWADALQPFIDQHLGSQQSRSDNGGDTRSGG